MGGADSDSAYFLVCMFLLGGYIYVYIYCLSYSFGFASSYKFD